MVHSMCCSSSATTFHYLSSMLMNSKGALEQPLYNPISRLSPTCIFTVLLTGTPHLQHPAQPLQPLLLQSDAIYLICLMCYQLLKLVPLCQMQL